MIAKLIDKIFKREYILPESIDSVGIGRKRVEPTDILITGNPEDISEMAVLLTVSRKHAVIKRYNRGENPRYTIQDSKSTSGTRVNDEYIKPEIPVKIKNGDSIRLGKYRLTFVLEEKVA